MQVCAAVRSENYFDAAWPPIMPPGTNQTVPDDLWSRSLVQTMYGVGFIPEPTTLVSPHMWMALRSRR